MSLAIEPQSEEFFSFSSTDGTTLRGRVVTRISRDVYWELKKNVLISLQQLAKALGVKGYSKLKKAQLLDVLRPLDRRFR